MKTLLLNTNHLGKDFYAVFPEDANGVAFAYLNERRIGNAINLSSVGAPGKLGTLYIERVDLRNIPHNDVEEIMENLNFEIFEPFLNSLEKELLDFKEESLIPDIITKREELWSRFKIENNKYKLSALSEAYVKEIEHFMKNKMITTIQVLASEKEQIENLILKNGFKIPKS